ncbi:septation protein SepH [Demequina sp. SYSU T00192]|uniref:Septation protein SepH n=1 Tax=Demequina litoralis TaxID=3051660 RepID=A0ABT8G5Z8_9MICO|nr:septation protein SepH [Demequina sp. SYSU T00192]MDN4474565.1 septation protein SepH [Demequina sp. SYSU T00192]
MTRLTLVGPSEDGLHLVVEAESGDRFELPLTDELRHAVRYTRPSRPAAQAPEEAEAPTMSPREIQQRIRAGLTAQELAELTGMSLAGIEKYEGPVAAERQYIADLARDTRIGRDPSAPQLGELVTDRLAARGVDPESVEWDAWREVDEPWKVAADYRVSGRGVRALWTFDHTARTVTAEDEEARWLSETELLDVPIPRRHLSAVRENEDDPARPLQATRPPAPATDAVPVVAADDAADEEIPLPPKAEPSPTELLLDDLELRRGTRETVDEDEEDDEDEFEGFGPARRAREAETGFGPSASRTRAEDAPAPEPAAAKREEPAERRTTKRGRASVPSWDEIVFGAKNDQG